MSSLGRVTAVPALKTAMVYGVLLDDAESDWPGRNQLAVAMSSHLPVVLLERSQPGDRRSVLRPSRCEQISANLFVVRNALPLRSHRLGRRISRLAALVDGRWLRTALAGVGLGDFVLWVTVNDPTLTLGVPRSRVVYDCMDPNFLPEGQASFDRTEFRLARSAALVMASAQSLHERMSRVNPRTFLLPNATARNDRLRERRGLVSPVTSPGLVGYVGTVDWRFDPGYVQAAATAMPHITFVIIGRVNAEQEDRVAALRQLENVRFLGQLDNREAGKWLGDFMAALIPFTPGAMNDAINPVKMHMYLAAGLPVVATNIAECVANEHVITGADPDSFASALADALAADNDEAVQQRQRYGRANTWERRAEEAISLLLTQGLLKHDDLTRPLSNTTKTA